VQVRAPLSAWNSLTTNELHVTADLSNATSGTVIIPLTAVVDERDARITLITPSEIQVTIEQLTARELPVRLEVSGVPATGYTARDASISPELITVSGPATVTDSVSEIVARVDLNNAKTPVSKAVELVPMDVNGNEVEDVTLEPSTANVNIPIEQLGGYRDVAVKVVVEGQVAAGYRITNVSVSPLVVTLFSSDPTAVNALPGFVETEPITIDGARDDVEQRVTLVLPEGVSPATDQTVLVQVSIAAIENSITFPHDLEIQGLGAGLAAFPSPTSVDVILSGPLPTLDSLTPESIRVVLNLLDLPPGLHQVTPEIVVLPEGVTVQTVLPATIEVLIIGPGTPTPTMIATPTLIPTIAPTRTPTRPPPTFTATATLSDAELTATVTLSPSPEATATP
jgi:YbbR domain-containing protein